MIIRNATIISSELQYSRLQTRIIYLEEHSTAAAAADGILLLSLSPVGIPFCGSTSILASFGGTIVKKSLVYFKEAVKRCWELRTYSRAE